jgi:hypothetical protein
VKSHGDLSRRRKASQPAMRVTGGWCVFFNRGCVLHAAGAGEGDKHRYKPAVCALFPATKDQHDRWQVRQQGYNGKIWDLFCLDPKASSVPAAVRCRTRSLWRKDFPVRNGAATKRNEMASDPSIAPSSNNGHH